MSNPEFIKALAEAFERRGTPHEASERVSKIIVSAFDLSAPYEIAVAPYLDTLASVLQPLSIPSLPSRTETCATADKLKTASLFFDRVWFPSAHFGAAAPPEVTFFAATELELATMACAIISEAIAEDEELQKYWRPVVERMSDQFSAIRFFPKDSPRTSAPRVLANILFAEAGIVATPMYTSTSQMRREYQSGSTEVLVAAISGLGIVDEEKLSWEQVLEFRKDKKSKLNLRRLRSWADRELLGKSLTQVEDNIAICLDDYEASLKKHGIETAIGTLSDFIDPATLSVASAAVASLALAGDGILGPLVGAGVLLGKATVSIARKAIDLEDARRGLGSEVAFVHELRQLTK